MRRRKIDRRTLLRGGVAASAVLAMPAYSRANRRPVFTHGVQSGDIDATSGMIWARADRPCRVMCEIATTEGFSGARKLAPLNALAQTDYAVKRLLGDLPADQDIFYRLTLADLADTNMLSEPVTGRFRTAPATSRSVRFAWSGDTAGQGWGIDATGMKTYSTIAGHAPDFFIHSGDTVYADGPLEDEVDLPDGSKWRNAVMTDEKRKVAETLDEFRGQWKYNLLDRHVLAMNAATPTFFQWDDHDVRDNWSPGLDLMEDDRYTEKSVYLLAARASRAFHEMTPVRFAPPEPGRIYRKIAYGPLLDIFFLDLRSYRGANGPSMQDEISDDSRILGETQLSWLKRELSASNALWKVIACDMPIGLIVWDDWQAQSGAEAVANGDNGPPLGRELEFSDLLAHIARESIENIVWLTADVHYAAAHYYNPRNAAFKDFEPFWEFVSGPLHAGTFGPNALDMTFGPEVRFMKAPPSGQFNLPPSAGMQFFGLVDIAGSNGLMTVRLMDRDDSELFRMELNPRGRA